MAGVENEKRRIRVSFWALGFMAGLIVSIGCGLAALVDAMRRTDPGRLPLAVSRDGCVQVACSLSSWRSWQDCGLHEEIPVLSDCGVRVGGSRLGRRPSAGHAPAVARGEPAAGLS